MKTELTANCAAALNQPMLINNICLETGGEITKKKLPEKILQTTMPKDMNNSGMASLELVFRILHTITALCFS